MAVGDDTLDWPQRFVNHLGADAQALRPKLVIALQGWLWRPASSVGADRILTTRAD